MQSIPYNGSDTTRPGTKPSTSAYATKPTMRSSKVVPIDTIGLSSALQKGRLNQPKLKSINDGINIPTAPWKDLRDEEKKLSDKRISNVTSAQQEYAASPLYVQRASKYKDGVKAQKLLLNALQTVKTDVKSGNQERAYPSRNLVTLEPQSVSPVISHELGHIMGARPGSESGVAMVLNYAEQAEIMSRNKNVQALSKQTGKTILNEGQMPIPITKSNTHKYAPWENKADIEGMRFIFFNNGITKKYGENLTPEQFKKALQNPKIKNQLQIKRLQENFEDKDIIQLNNMLAKTNIAEQQNLA